MVVRVNSGGGYGGDDGDSDDLERETWHAAVHGVLKSRT